jgi:tripartite-type tricarboxylate transporter receptor subunit TctC
MAQARKPGAKFNYGSSGIGSFAHLAGHEFSRLADLDMTHIPYKGGSDVVTGCWAARSRAASSRPWKPRR